MPKLIPQNLSGVAETLLIPLCVRAVEYQRADALIKDEKAVELVRQLGYDPSQVLAKIAEETRVAKLLCARQIDRCAQDFIRRCPQAVVVHIGCGLDTRFERVDNGQVDWYDLDLPAVIDLRRMLLGGESARYHMLAGSALEAGWLETLPSGASGSPRPVMFLAEGVLLYFEEAQVKTLVLTLQAHFPGAELVFDAFSPFLIWANNLRVTRTHVGTPAYWGLKRGKDLESWGEGIRLLEEWFPYLIPEPRLRQMRWVRFMPLLTRSIGLFHYRLGEIVR